MSAADTRGQEAHLEHVSNYLRTELAECAVDGVEPYFEIDNEQPPYIRGLSFPDSDIAEKIRKIDPREFEKVCAAVLERLGAQSYVTQATNDGGVDFVGTNLKIVPEGFNVPAACKAAVIGQAKRYKEGNAINEVRLREFVGASALRRHLLQRDGAIGPLTPVLCAFWTTSSFDPNAKTYARAIGLWYMDGRTLAKYVAGLGLKGLVMSMPDKQ
jgi:restriction endonuclease Mrr